MLRKTVAARLAVLGAVVLSAAAPAAAQFGGPSQGPGVPSYNPGVPSYNPGVPSQSPASSSAYGHVRSPNQPHSPTNVVPQPGETRFVYPYGYGHGATPIIVPQRRSRNTMGSDSFFSDDPPF